MSNQSALSKIALPYAEALLESAQETDLLEKTSEDLSSLSRLLSQSNELEVFLENPLIAPSAKKIVLNNLLLNKINDFVLKFLLVLVDRRRISLINNIIDKYLELAYRLESIVVAEVSTASLLTEVQQENLVNKLKNITSSNQVKLVIQLDSSLIAGFTVKLGSKVIDTSLSGKLKQMAFYLNEV